MTHFLQQNGWQIARLTFEHLWLTLSAMLLAAAIGLPLGVLLTRHEKLAKPVIAFANIIQTIPSLALFGLLLPVPWLGENAARLAILALTGYALLPILRNTYAGIRSVDPALEDVARALGMTSWQRLTKVELPARPSRRRHPRLPRTPPHHPPMSQFRYYLSSRPMRLQGVPCP